MSVGSTVARMRASVALLAAATHDDKVIGAADRRIELSDGRASVTSGV